MAECHTCHDAGWVKYYVTKHSPGVPTWLSEDGEGIRWVGAGEGYVLCLCPSCATVAGKRKNAHKEAA